MADEIRIPLIYEENLSGLIRAAEETKKLKAATDEMTAASKKAFDENATTVEDYAKELEAASGSLADLESTTKDANKENKALSDTLKESVRGLTLFGVNIGGAIDSLKQKQAALKGAVTGIRSLSGAFNILKVAIASTGIGLLLIALGSLVAFLTKTDRGIEIVERAMAGLSAAMSVIIDRASTLGEGLVKLFTGDFRGALESTQGVFKGIGDEIGREVEKAVELTRALQNLEDVQRSIRVEYAQQRAAIEALREASIDENKSFKERSESRKKALAIENDLEAKRIAAAEENLRIIKEQNAQKEVLDEDRDKEADAIIEVANIRQESAARRRRDEQFLQGLQRQQLAILKQQQEEEKKLAEQRLAIEQKNREVFQKLKSDLAAQITQEDLLRDSEKERLEFQQKNALESLRLAEEELTAKAKALGREGEIEEIRRDFARLRFLTNERFEFEITQIVEAENRKRIESDQERQEKLSADSERVLNTLNGNLQAQAEIDQKKIDLIEESNDKELSLEQYKEQEKLRIQLESLKKQKENAEAFGVSPLSLEAQQLDGQIAEVESKLNTLSSLPVLDRIKNKFKNLFNLNDEDLNEIGSQLQGAVNDVFEGFNALVEAQIAEQDALIEKRQEAIDKLEEQLNEELELQKNGFANSASAKEAALAKEREALKKDKLERLALEKKAANLRLKQEGLQVASSLLVSVANVLAAESSKGIVGVILAIAAAASIFAFIAKARAQSKQFESAEKLREGTRLEGPTHEHGGIPLVVDDGAGGRRLFEAEDKEWLIGTKPSIEHDSFLERLNNNEFAGIDLNRIMDMGSQRALPALPDVLTPAVLQARESTKRASEYRRENERLVMVEAMGTMFQSLENRVGGVERAIWEKPEHIPITEFGWITKKRKGNTETTSIYEAPKKRNKAG